MDLELKIRFDGSTPGLAEHRLSLSEFQKALGRLVSAVRRTATSIETDATEPDPQTGAGGGRYSKLARHLDVQLAGLDDGCVEARFTISHEPPPGKTHELFRDFEKRSLERLVEHIQNEGEGTPSSAAVRKYLKALPDGVDSQRYAVLQDGEETHVVELGAYDVIEDEDTGVDREVRRVTGFVNRVSFDEEGTGTGVDISGEDDTIRGIDAKPALVDKALELRGKEIVAQVLFSGSDKRLLTIWSAEAPPESATNQERESKLLDDWEETLSELAKC